MSLLFDENLSHHLVGKLADLFPHAIHVRDAGLKKDIDIWAFAKIHGLTIVTKDEDFETLSLIYGSPPKVIWIRNGNEKSMDTAKRFRKRQHEIREFLQSSELKILALE